MTGEVCRRDLSIRQQERIGDLDPIFEVQIADGIDGQRLAAQQAAVIYEVMAWLAHNPPERGPDRRG